ncbi:MAG: hypothetical protein RIC55_09135 [Pirellulaceae bacterium]
MSLFLLAAGFGGGWSAYRWKHRQELDDLHATLEKWEGVTYVEGLDILFNADEALVQQEREESRDPKLEEALRKRLSDRGDWTSGFGAQSNPSD